MAVRTSLDEAQTWDPGTVVWSGPSGYSDMVRLSEKKAGLLYEAGVDGPYEGIFFAGLKTKHGGVRVSHP